jgi:hypothetical protein
VALELLQRGLAARLQSRDHAVDPIGVERYGANANSIATPAEANAASTLSMAACLPSDQSHEIEPDSSSPSNGSKAILNARPVAPRKLFAFMRRSRKASQVSSAISRVNTSSKMSAGLSVLDIASRSS